MFDKFRHFNWCSPLNIFNFLILSIFITCSFMIAPFHENWSDEVQAFIIARDADWTDILTIIPRQESQPTFWHLLLKLLILLFGENINLSYVSIFVMSLTIGIFLFCYKVPLIYKILLPFGYYFLYQYNIFSRNYCLSYLAFALLGLLYANRHIQVWRYAAVLFLLAESTTFLTPIAAVLGVFWLYESFALNIDKKKHLTAFGVLGLIGLFTLWQLFPINPTNISIRSQLLNLSPLNALVNVFETFFIGNNVLLNVIFFICGSFFGVRYIFSQSFVADVKSNLPKLYQFGIIWFVFLLTYIMILPIFYHQGLIWGLFLVTVYMFFPDYIQRSKHYFFIACMLMQIFWGYKAIAYDLTHQLSAQNEVMKILAKHNIRDTKIQAIGYQTLPIQNLLTKKNLYLQKDEPIYYMWDKTNIVTHENTQPLVNLHYDVMVIGKPNAEVADLSYYENKEKFYIYDVPAALTYKGYIFYNQGVKLYISKDKDC